MLMQVVMVGGVPVKFAASAALLRMYRAEFNRDMLADIDTIMKSASYGDCIEITENIAYIMAKHADESIPDILTWLAQFSNPLSVADAMPGILAVWGKNTETLECAKKNAGRPPDK